MQHFRMTLTSKGQVTLPAEYRKALGLEAGQSLTLLLDDEGHATLRKSRSMDEFVGSLSDAASGAPLTKGDLRAAVSDAVSERYDRGRPKAKQ